MKKKLLNKTSVSILTALGIVVGGLLLLKAIADSESRVEY